MAAAAGTDVEPINGIQQTQRELTASCLRSFEQQTPSGSKPQRARELQWAGALASENSQQSQPGSQPPFSLKKERQRFKTRKKPSTESLDKKEFKMNAIFPDKAQMMEEVRNFHFADHAPRIGDEIYKETGCCQRVASHRHFDVFMFAVIGLNAIWLALDADLRSSELLVHSHLGIQIVEHTFCTIYVIEWAIRLGWLRKVCFICRDWWLLFDTCIVFLMVLESWLLSILVTCGVWGDGNIPGVGFVRVMRLMRLARLSRLVRLLKLMPEVLCLVKGMLAATRAVLSLLALLTCIIYMFAIALRQLSRGTEMGARYFSSVPFSMYTLVLKGAFLDDISGLMDAMLLEDPVSAFVMAMLVLVAAVTMMNMLIGILCEATRTTAEVEKEEIDVDFLKKALFPLVQVNDIDKDHKISEQEFKMLLGNKEACKALRKVKVNPERMVEFAEFFFQSDVEGIDLEKKLEFDDFMQLVLKLRGHNAATVADTVELQHFINCQSKQTFLHMKHLEEQVQDCIHFVIGLYSDPDMDMSDSRSCLNAKQEYQEVVKATATMRSE